MPGEGTMQNQALPQASSKYKVDLRGPYIEVYFGLKKRALG